MAISELTALLSPQCLSGLRGSLGRLRKSFTARRGTAPGAPHGCPWGTAPLAARKATPFEFKQGSFQVTVRNSVGSVRMWGIPFVSEQVLCFYPHHPSLIPTQHDTHALRVAGNTARIPLLPPSTTPAQHHDTQDPGLSLFLHCAKFTPGLGSLFAADKAPVPSDWQIPSSPRVYTSRY